MAHRTSSQLAHLPPAAVRRNTQDIAGLKRSNNALVERCNTLTRNVATMAAAFMLIVEAGGGWVGSAVDAEDVAEFNALSARLEALLACNAEAAAAGTDGADTAAGTEEGPPVTSDAPPPYEPGM